MVVTRVGNVGYLSWMSFSRYSDDWDAPHGILYKIDSIRDFEYKVKEG